VKDVPAVYSMPCRTDEISKHEFNKLHAQDGEKNEIYIAWYWEETKIITTCHGRKR
jgi:hypothetical protein